MVRITRGLVFCAALLAGGLIARADDSNPAYDSWAKAKVGTVVKYNSTTDTGTMKMESETTYTLKEVAADAVKVELGSAMVMNGTKTSMPPQTMTIQKATKSTGAAAPAAEAPKTDTSKEDVTIDGKSYSCTVTTTNSDSNGMKTTSKVWTCNDVPGTMVKSETNTTGAMTASTKMALVSVTEGK